MEPQNLREDETQQCSMTVTSDEFAAIDVEPPIRESDKVDCWSLGGLHQSAASRQDEPEGGPRCCKCVDHWPGAASQFHATQS